ncbi:MAG: hypothetical protein HQM02_08930 [Magnetococcales bacterium]|nr:hypothetical protein [Magnetococcales bacterium]
MIAKSPVTETSWVDPDDAPELTGEEMDHPDAVWTIGGQQVISDDGKAAFRKMLKIDHPTNIGKRVSPVTRPDPEGATVFPA